MKQSIRVISAIALIIGSGLVHGAWTNRWRMSPAVEQLIARLEKVPTTVGPWTMTKKRDIEPRELSATGAAGYVSRVYSNASTGQRVSLLLLSGLPGDITMHTPDVCYPGAGFLLGKHEKFTREYGKPARSAELNTAIAKRGGTDPSTLRLYWSWLSSRGWAAPDDARWAYATESALTKLYVVRETGGAQLDPNEDPCNTFLADFLPVLDQTMNLSTNETEGVAN